MDKRPDELNENPLGRPDPLDEFDRGADPLADPAARAGAIPDPAVTGEPEVDEVEVTRVEIERTRADMSETVDAIQNKLSPQNLKEQAKDRVKEATVGRAQEAGSGVVETIRQNPLPAALTGLGLGWLLMSARKQGTTRPGYQQGYVRTYRDDAYAYPATYEERGPEGSSAVGDARDKVGEVAGRAQDRAGRAADQVQHKAERAATRTRNQAERLGDQARYQARRASSGFQRMLRENPLAVGALAAGAGAAVGLAIPETYKEHEVMGEARDNLVEKAQEKAQETQQKVQRVAEEAQSAAKEEAGNQGLTDQ